MNYDKRRGTRWNLAEGLEDSDYSEYNMSNDEGRTEDQRRQDEGDE